MAAFAEMNPMQTAAIQEWVTAQLDSRMELIGRAATFVDQIDQKQREAIAQLELERTRTNDIVVAFNASCVRAHARRLLLVTWGSESSKQTAELPQHASLGEALALHQVSCHCEVSQTSSGQIAVLSVLHLAFERP